MDDVVTDEKKGPPSEALSSRPGMPADFSSLDLASLAAMAVIPEKYQALMPFITAYRDKLETRLSHQTQEHEDSFLRKEFQAAAMQREIDRNVLDLNINGTDVHISQGELRKMMTERVEELEERKKALEKSGENPEELERINRRIEADQTAIKDTKSGKVNEQGKQDIQRALQLDPEFAERVKSLHSAPDAATKEVNRRTSFSAEVFGDTTTDGSAMKNQFTKSASPDAQGPAPSPAAPSPPPQNDLRKVENTVQSLAL